jgi:uncharacterized protein involved in outer membrane biogenesis
MLPRVLFAKHKDSFNMKWLKWFFTLSFILVATLILSLILLAWFINPNDYKPQLQATIKKETGRDLIIAGEIHWRFWPWFSLEINQLQFSNAKGFEPEPFLKAEQIKVRVKTLPLLQRHLYVDIIQLNQAHIRLARNEEGQTNWDDLLQLTQKSEPSPTKSPPFKQITFSGIALNDSTIDWQDALTQQHQQFSQINVKTGEINYPEMATLPLELSATLSTKTADQKPLLLHFNFNTDLNIHIAASHFSLTKTQLNIHYPELSPLNAALTLKMADLSLDLIHEKLTGSGIHLTLLELVELHAQLQVKELMTAARLETELTMAEFNPRTLLTYFNIALPDGLQDSVLTRSSLSAMIHADTKKMMISDWMLNLDQGQVQIPQVILDLENNQLTVSQWIIDWLNTQANGHLSIKNIMGEKPELFAEISLLTAIKPLLAELFVENWPIPELLSKTQLSLSTEIHSDLSDWQLKQFRLQLDQQQLRMAQLKTKANFSQITLEQLQVDAFDGNMLLNAEVNKINDNYGLSGNVSIKPFNPSDLLHQFAITLPERKDKNTLTRFGFNTVFSGTLDNFALDNLQLQLDDSLLTGKINVNLLQPHQLDFNLAVDQFNVDRYLPPESSVKKSPNPSTETEELLPVALLKKLQVQGVLKVRQLQTMGAKLSDVTLSIKGKNGQLQVDKTLGLYQGLLQGETRLNVNAVPAQLDSEYQLDQVALSPLLKDTTQTNFLEGIAQAHVQLNTRFIYQADILENLTGKIAVELKNGSINGFNLARSLRQARAILKQEPMPPPEPLKSDFSRLMGTFTVEQGLLKTNTLLIESPLLRVNGKGNIDLPKETLDLRLETWVVNTSTGQEGKSLEILKGVGIPIFISGTFSAPQVKPDYQVLLSTGLGALQPEIKSEKSPLFQPIQSHESLDLENLKELGQSVGHFLRGLKRDP